MRNGRLLLVASVLAVAALALTAPAGAVIVPQKGMAGVELGMTRPQVRATLGTPLRIIRGVNDFGAYTEFRYPHRVRVTFQGNAGATAVSTTGTHERTAKGAGVGTREARLRNLHPNVRCRTDFGFRHCWLGRFQPGKRVTDFAIENGRVERVVVGVVID